MALASLQPRQQISDSRGLGEDAGTRFGHMSTKSFGGTTIVKRTIWNFEKALKSSKLGTGKHLFIKIIDTDRLVLTEGSKQVPQGGYLLSGAKKSVLGGTYKERKVDPLVFINYLPVDELIKFSENYVNTYRARLESIFTVDSLNNLSTIIKSKGVTIAGLTGLHIPIRVAGSRKLAINFLIDYGFTFKFLTPDQVFDVKNIELANNFIDKYAYDYKIRESGWEAKNIYAKLYHEEVDKIERAREVIDAPVSIETFIAYASYIGSVVDSFVEVDQNRRPIEKTERGVSVSKDFDPFKSKLITKIEQISGADNISGTGRRLKIIDIDSLAEKGSTIIQLTDAPDEEKAQRSKISMLPELIFYREGRKHTIPAGYMGVRVSKKKNESYNPYDAVSTLAILVGLNETERRAYISAATPGIENKKKLIVKSKEQHQQPIIDMNTFLQGRRTKTTEPGTLPIGTTSTFPLPTM